MSVNQIQISLKVIDNDEKLGKLRVEEVRAVNNFPKYEGEYTATPCCGDKLILETKDKTLRENIEIEPIPYNEVTNFSGGYTVTIGG